MRRAVRLFIIVAVSLVCAGILLLLADRFLSPHSSYLGDFADSDLGNVGQDLLFLGAACGWFSILLAWLGSLGQNDHQ
jgi:hypothetical protein